MLGLLPPYVCTLITRGGVDFPRPYKIFAYAAPFAWKLKELLFLNAFKTKLNDFIFFLSQWDFSGWIKVYIKGALNFSKDNLCNKHRRAPYLLHKRAMWHHCVCDIYVALCSPVEMDAFGGFNQLLCWTETHVGLTLWGVQAGSQLRQLTRWGGRRQHLNTEGEQAVVHHLPLNKNTQQVKLNPTCPVQEGFIFLLFESFLVGFVRTLLQSCRFNKPETFRHL